MKSHSLLFMALLALGSISPAVAMMRAPGSEAFSTPQKPMHDKKKHPADKTPSSQQQNYPTVPLTAPVKQNR